MQTPIAPIPLEKEMLHPVETSLVETPAVILVETLEAITEEAITEETVVMAATEATEV